VLDFGRRRNRAGHRRMRNNELQEELRPILAVELAGPLRQRFFSRDREERAAIERTIDHHRDAALGGEWEQPLLDTAIGYIIGELHKVEALAPQRELHLVVTG